MSRPRPDSIARRFIDAGADTRPIRLAIDPRTGRRDLPGVDRLDDPRVRRVVATVEKLHPDARAVVDSTGRRWAADLVVLAAGANASASLLVGAAVAERRPGRRHLGRVVELTTRTPIAPVGWFTTSLVLPDATALVGVTRTGPLAVVALDGAVTVGDDHAGQEQLDAATDAFVDLAGAAGVGILDPRTEPGGLHHEAATVSDTGRSDGLVVADPSTWTDLVDGPPMATVAAVAAARVTEALGGPVPTPPG